MRLRGRRWSASRRSETMVLQAGFHNRSKLGHPRLAACNRFAISLRAEEDLIEDDIDHWPSQLVIGSNRATARQALVAPAPRDTRSTSGACGRDSAGSHWTRRF